MSEGSKVTLKFDNGNNYWGRPHLVEVFGEFKYKSQRDNFAKEVKALVAKYES